MNVRARTANVRTIFESTRLYQRVSIFVPFLVISIALGGLAYRSWQLSVRMERSVEGFAIQYLGYAAEVSARRADTAVRTAMSSAVEQWQAIERSSDSPGNEELLEWISSNPWIISAIYIPDSAPEEAVYFRDETAVESAGAPRSEFFTASGSVRYSYDPSRLVMTVARTLRGRPAPMGIRLPVDMPDQSRLDVVPTPPRTGLEETDKGFAVIVPLSPPLTRWSVRASITASPVESGWSSHRVVSLWFAALAFVLLVVGMTFAIRGLAREAEAMKLRADLIANVSHELRTPLSMIRLGAETLKRGANLGEKERGDLQESILREVIHLSHLVENVLDVARLQKGRRPLKLAPVYPSDLVHSLIETYHSWLESKGFSVELEIDEEIEEQMWDGEAVSRAVLNLVDNAVKYSAAEKRVSITVSQGPETVSIAVRDHGLGIPAGELKRIFEPYYRAAFSDTETRRGAGLGLTLVHQIMRSHGGRVEVESLRGEGATFRLVFPKNIRKGRQSVSALSEVQA